LLEKADFLEEIDGKRKDKLERNINLKIYPNTRE